MEGFSVFSRQGIYLALVVGLLYIISLAIYRLYFSPLAKFPGPKLAALTTKYNAYYDLVEGGQFVWEVERMHKVYGPVVRVRPDALSVNDPEWIEKIYSQNPKHRRERYKTILQTLQAPSTILGTKDHDLHRKRRAVLNPFFSQQSVRRLEPAINDTLANLLYRMEKWGRNDEVIHMNVPFRAATKDVIQAYALGEGEKFLLMDDCNAPFFDILTPQRVCYLGSHVYWLAWTMARLPPAIMVKIVPRIGVFANWMTALTKRIETIQAAKEHPEGKTIFHEIMGSDIPESEKETRRLADEAMIMLVAGSETTASTLAAIMYHLLDDRKLLNRLKAELKTVMPESTQLPSGASLDNLPFLNALIQEALRLYPGATHRQDRVCPDESILLESEETGQTYTIPPNTAVGMSPSTVNRHPRIYGPDADVFRPDRYLESPHLSRYLFSFGKGTRICLGMNLALQELRNLTAGIFRKYDMYDAAKSVQTGPTLELFETERSDVAMWADYVTPAPRPGSQGLRIKIRN